MNNFPSKTNPEWVDVPQLEQNMPVLAGEGHPSNWQARALAERTDYLHKMLQNIIVPEPGENGINGISVLSSNESALILADEEGNVTSYAYSGCTLQVLEGAVALAYDGLGNSPGKWKVTATGTDITPGVITGTADGAVVGNHSGMPKLAQTAVVNYLITGQSLSGVPFQLPKLQSFIKVSSAEGNDGMSAYELAVEAGFVGTYTEWLASLKGTDGVDGVDGVDGTDGKDGMDGNRSYSRAITGSAWSDTEALQAYRDWGVADPVVPVLGDTVTLYNVSLKYSEMREYTSTGWKVVVSRIPGSAIMVQSITTEQLLVTGMGASVSPDPNTQDITAWFGDGISLVNDPSAPNGTTAIRVTAEQSVVLSRPFPIDRSLNYRIRAWVRGQATTSAYLILSFLDANGNPLQGSAHNQNWPFSMLYHAYGLIDSEVPTVYTEYSASFGPDEEYGIPVGAKSLRIGVYANMAGPGVLYFSGMYVQQKVYGSVLVDGSVKARHITSNGMVIYNEEGDVILSAKGASTPPWVVDLVTTTENNSVSLVKPKDNENRSAIRNLLADNKTVFASVSPNGNSILLSAKGTELWRVVYKSALNILVTDGQSLVDYSFFELEPNKAYQFEFLLYLGRATTATPVCTAQFFLQAPIGSQVIVNGGGAISITNDTPQQIDSLTVNSDLIERKMRVLLVTGTNGGMVKLFSTALNQNFSIKRDTTFTGRELDTYVDPVSSATNIPATVVTPFTETPNRHSTYSVATPAESYKVQMSLTLDAVGGPNLSSKAYTGALRGLTGPTLHWNSTTNELSVIHAISTASSTPNLILTTHDYIGPDSWGTDDTIYGAGFKAVWLKGFTPAEVARWKFYVSANIVSRTKFNEVFAGIPTTEKEIINLYDDADTVEYDGDSDVLAYSANQTDPLTPFGVVIDYTIKAKRLGVEMGTWTYRLNLNFI